MDQGISGVSADTPKRFILDAGQLYANVDLTALEGTSADPVADAVAAAIHLGATKGGAQFNPNRTMRQIEVDGQLGDTLGFNRRQSIKPVLTANLVEMTVDNMKRMIAGAVSETKGAFTKITGGPVKSENYLTNVVLFATYSGSSRPVVIGVENALVMEAPDFSTEDDNEVAAAFNFSGHFNPATPYKEPWFIYHPGEDV